jgi:hypothetical protein
MEPRISPNLEAHVDVFGRVSRKEEGKAILRKEAMSYEVREKEPDRQSGFQDDHCWQQ